MIYFVVFMMGSNGHAAPPEKASTCVACHGEKGVSANDLWPNLAGQKIEYLKKQMHEFKKGSRENELMTGVARSLSDREIDELADYYSRLECGK
ncbi:MAG: cytochrome c [Bdellovibrionales bacterium]